MTSRQRSGLRVSAAVLVVVALAAGCGVSTQAVRAGLPATTAAPTSTAPSTTAAPTTTEASSTTQASTTLPDTLLPPLSTEPPSTGGTSGTLPPEIKSQFMTSCVDGGAPSSVCTCIWDKIKSELSVQQLLDAGNNGSLPADLEKKVIDAATACASQRTS